jgi:hypothetical protein
MLQVLGGIVKVALLFHWRSRISSWLMGICTTPSTMYDSSVVFEKYLNVRGGCDANFFSVNALQVQV